MIGSVSAESVLVGREEGLHLEDAAAFDTWLAANGASARELWVVIFKKSSHKQSVTFHALLEVALTRGWVDVQTKGTDEERYGIRFVARKPGSNWSATNRKIVKRLIADGRMHEAGAARLPPDLFADE